MLEFNENPWNLSRKNKQFFMVSLMKYLLQLQPVLQIHIILSRPIWGPVLKLDRGGGSNPNPAMVCLYHVSISCSLAEYDSYSLYKNGHDSLDIQELPDPNQ